MEENVNRAQNKRIPNYTYRKREHNLSKQILYKKSRFALFVLDSITHFINFSFLCKWEPNECEDSSTL